ncbi:MAG: hypothetical protein ABDI07_12200, partial [Candidatus Kryptonium sp.]
MSDFNMEAYIQNLIIYSSDFLEGLKKLGFTGGDKPSKEEVYKFIFEKIPDRESGFSDFLMGFLNLLYKDFNIDFFKSFDEVFLLYHISKHESDLKRLIDIYYAGKLIPGIDDYSMSKLGKYKRDDALQVLDLFVLMGRFVPDVYKNYDSYKKDPDMLKKRELKGKPAGFRT